MKYNVREHLKQIEIFVTKYLMVSVKEPARIIKKSIINDSLMIKSYLSSYIIKINHKLRYKVISRENFYFYLYHPLAIRFLEVRDLLVVVYRVFDVIFADTTKKESRSRPRDHGLNSKRGSASANFWVRSRVWCEFVELSRFSLLDTMSFTNFWRF